jgi:transcriptional regulator with XRE-family HTH domain
MIENGIRIPRLPMVEQLARVLGLSPSRLAFGFELELIPVVPHEGLRCAGFADRLREARSLRDVTMRELGRASGVIEGTVRAMERGTMPQVDTVEAVAKALGVSPAWLAFGEGPREIVRRRGKLDPDQPPTKQRTTQSASCPAT